MRGSESRGWSSPRLLDRPGPGREYRERSHAASAMPNHGTSGCLRAIEVNIPALSSHQERR